MHSKEIISLDSDIQTLKLILNKKNNYISLNNLDKKYIGNLLSLYNSIEDIIDNEKLSSLSKDINKSENSNLLKPVEKFKWWSLRSWLNKSKHKEQEKANKLEFERREDEIYNTLLQYTKEITRLKEEIESIKEVISEDKYKEICKKVINKEDVTTIINAIINDKENKKIQLKEQTKEIEIAKEYVKQEVIDIEVEEESEATIDLSSIEEETETLLEEISVEKETKIPILIENFFSENKYNKFVTYCQENSLIKLEELKDFNFDILLSIKGFGATKVNQVKERFESCNENYYHEIKPQETSTLEDGTEVLEVISNYKINKAYEHIDINILKKVKINSKLLEQILENFDTLGDLNTVDIKEYLISKGANKYRVDTMIEPLAMFTKESNELFKELLDDIKASKHYFVLKQRSNGDTLEAIGEQQGVTRERIRQIEDKLVKGKVTFLTTIFDYYIIDNLTNKKNFALNELSSIIKNEEDLIVLGYCIKKGICPTFEYFEEIDKYLVNENVKDVKRRLNNTLEVLPEIFSIYDEDIDLEELLSENNLEFITKEDYGNYLIKSNYKERGKYFIKGNVHKTKLYTFIINMFFKNGLNFNDKDQIQKLKYIAEHDFGTIIDENDRAIKSNVERGCVLRDVSTYIHPNRINIDYNLLNEIKKYIDDIEISTIYIADIYEEFREKLNEFSNIDNREFLHGILKYFYSSEYSFTRDTLSKSDDKISGGQILENYLREKACIMSKKEIKNDLKGWTDIMFAINSSLRRDVLNWDSSHYVISDMLNITEEDKTYLKEAILNSLKEDGYTNAMILYYNLKDTMKEFFDKNNIKNYNNLYSILIYLFEEDFKFRRPHILNKDISLNIDINIINIIKYKLKEKEYVSIDDIKATCKNLRLKESTLSTTMERIVDELIEIETDKYIFKENKNK